MSDDKPKFEDLSPEDQLLALEDMCAPPTRREVMIRQALPLDKVAADYPDALEFFDRLMPDRSEVVFVVRKKSLRAEPLDPEDAPVAQGTHGRPRDRLSWHAGARVWVRFSCGVKIAGKSSGFSDAERAASKKLQLLEGEDWVEVLDDGIAVGRAGVVRGVACRECGGRVRRPWSLSYNGSHLCARCVRAHQQRSPSLVLNVASTDIDQCTRSACRSTTNDPFVHRDTGKLYCPMCAVTINRANGQKLLEPLYPVSPPRVIRDARFVTSAPAGGIATVVVVPK